MVANVFALATPFLFPSEVLLLWLFFMMVFALGEYQPGPTIDWFESVLVNTIPFLIMADEAAILGDPDAIGDLPALIGLLFILDMENDFCTVDRRLTSYDSKFEGEY